MPATRKENKLQEDTWGPHKQALAERTIIHENPEPKVASSDLRGTGHLWERSYQCLRQPLYLPKITK